MLLTNNSIAHMKLYEAINSLMPGGNKKVWHT